MLWKSVLVATVAVGFATPGFAAELRPETQKAFSKYVAEVESRIDVDRFLWLDSLPADRRESIRAEVKRGGLILEKLDRDTGVPGGLIHHWIGAAFVPGATLDQAVALLQDYNRHSSIYAPNVAGSRLLSREGDDFRVFLRFAMKKVITVVVNSEHRAQFTREGRDRVRSRIVSTRIAEVADPGTPDERELPVGQDGGYLWRLNSYWRFVQRDGGVYIECESISLTRGIPRGLGWVVGPFVTSIPRESLSFTLETTRKTLQGRS